MENIQKQIKFLTELEIKEKCEKKYIEYEKIINTYFTKYHNKKDNRTIKKILYSIGGETIHRGYFCPSPIIDLYTSNVRRGRLLIKPTKEISYKYYFDENNNIIKSYIFDKDTETYNKEYIWYENNIQYSICLDQKNYIEYVSQSIYKNNKIIEYEIFLYLGDNSVMDIHNEKYYYDENNKLKYATTYNYNKYKEQYIVSFRDLMKFNKNEKEKVISYDIKTIYDNGLSESVTLNIPKSKQRNLEKFTEQSPQ